MNRHHYEKQLLLQRIEAQRRLSRLELQGMQDRVSPWAHLAKLSRDAAAVAGPARKLAATLGGDDPAQRRMWFRGAVAVIVLAPLIGALLRRR